MEVLSAGVHGLEIRVDLLAKDKDGAITAQLLGEQFAALRRINVGRLPIIFTIRTQPQGGGFTGDEQALFTLLNLGLLFFSMVLRN